MKEKTADIDILEELVVDARKEITIEERQAIITLISENKELKEERDMYRSQVNSAFKNGFIHKSKVEELLDKYNNILEYAETEEGMAEIKDFEYNEAKYGINALQSLLGKE